MAAYEIIRLLDRPAFKETMAQWFHEKWNIPKEAYLDSMDTCLQGRRAIPQWYAAIARGAMIGGLGVIENDFHNRKDLTPNVCAVYVEKAHRGQGIAGKMLDFVCRDMRQQGINTLYLLTDHTAFYERYGWDFLCMVQGDDGGGLSRMYVHTYPVD